MATANPDHQPCVPVAGGVPPHCTCGWSSGRFPKDGGLLADHLRQHDPAYGETRNLAPVEPRPLITREQGNAWAGRNLTDDEWERLAAAIPHSSIPDAIATTASAMFDRDDDE